MGAEQIKAREVISQFLARSGKGRDPLTDEIALYGVGLELDSLEVAELSAISRRRSSPTLLRWRDGAGRGRPDRLAEASADRFHPAADGEFEHGQARTADSLTATIATHSHLLTMDEAERSALLARIRDFLAARPETSHGEFTLPLVTMALRMVRR